MQLQPPDSRRRVLSTCLALVVALAACGGSAAPPTTSPPAAAPATSGGRSRATALPLDQLWLDALPQEAQLHTELPIYRHVLYADAGGALYSQPLAGGPAVRLGDGAAEGRLMALAITLDGDELIAGLPDGIYRIALDDGRRTRIAATPRADPGAALVSPQVSPDGAYAVFLVSGPKPQAWAEGLRETTWPVALYSVPLAGGAMVRLSPPLDAGSAIGYPMITPDSRMVVYSTEVPDLSFVTFRPPEPTRTAALYSVPIGGGVATRLADSPSPENPIQGRMITDNSRYVLYEPRSGTALSSVPVAGGPIAQLSASTTEQILSYLVIPDWQAVLYLTGATDYLVPIAGGATSDLGSRLTGGRIVAAILTPDGQDLVLRTLTAVYRLPVSGGPPVRLATLSGMGNLMLAGDRVLYGEQDRISSVPLSGGAVEQLTAALAPGATLRAAQLSPDGRYLLSVVEQAPGLERAVYSTPATGGAPVLLLSGALNSWPEALTEHVAIWRAGTALYALPLAGGAPALLTAAATEHLPTLISADGRQVVFVGRSRGAPSLFVAQLPPHQ